MQEYAKRGRNLYNNWVVDGSVSPLDRANTTYDDLTMLLGHESSQNLRGIFYKQYLFLHLLSFFFCYQQAARFHVKMSLSKCPTMSKYWVLNCTRLPSINTQIFEYRYSNLFSCSYWVLALGYRVLILKYLIYRYPNLFSCSYWVLVLSYRVLILKYLSYRYPNLFR